VVATAIHHFSSKDFLSHCVYLASLFCTLIIAQGVEFVNPYFLESHPTEQNQNNQTREGQTQSRNEIFKHLAVVLAVINGAMVCVINVTADAIADVSKQFFHGSWLLSFVVFIIAQKGLVVKPLLRKILFFF
jgi:hypothetical protein